MALAICRFLAACSGPGPCGLFCGSTWLLARFIWTGLIVMAFLLGSYRFNPGELYPIFSRQKVKLRPGWPGGDPQSCLLIGLRLGQIADGADQVGILQGGKLFVINQ